MIVTSKRNSMRSLLLWLRFKVTPIFFFRYAKKCICESDIGSILNPHSQLLVNERLEICSLLFDQFNNVFTSANINMIVHDPASFFSCQSMNPDECLLILRLLSKLSLILLMYFLSSLLQDHMVFPLLYYYILQLNSSQPLG